MRRCLQFILLLLTASAFAYAPAPKDFSQAAQVALKLTVNAVNQLSTINRSGTLTVSGETSTLATNVTVNGADAALYADFAFAKDGFADGTNTFTAIAQATNGVLNTNVVSVSHAATQTFAYDANGNLISDGKRGLDYDDENQLASVTMTNQFKKEFVYDGMRRLRVRKEFAWISSAWTQTNETRFIYDGAVIVQMRDSNNVPTLSFTRGLDLSGSFQGAGGTGGLLAMSDHITTSKLLKTSLYHADGNGNVTCLISTNGLIVGKALFDPFGALLAWSGPRANVNPFWFSSQLYDNDTGYSHYLYRVYSPDLQRWLNADPIGEAGGINLFGFVGNEPINEDDPFGLTNQPGDFGWGNYSQPMSAIPYYVVRPFMPQLVLPPPRPYIPPGCPSIGPNNDSPISRDTLNALGASHLGGTQLGRQQLEVVNTAITLPLPFPKIRASGSSARLSSGTTLARTTREQLAIEQVAANPNAGIKLPTLMTDARWPACSGWEKWQQVVKTGGDPINVHYVVNPISGQVDDLKIVVSGTR